MREKGGDTGRRTAEQRAKAKGRRDAAARARRLAQAVTQDDDRAQLLDYAKSLDAEADSLENQPPDPGVPHKQQQPQQQTQPQQQAQQAQQQAATGPPPDDKPPPDGNQGNGKKSRG